MANNLGNGIFSLQEFYNRGVIKLAPDVLVYIGGSLTTQVIAPVSGTDNNLSFNDGITNVSIQNNVDPPGSSTASIEIATPIYGENSKYWVSYPSLGEGSDTKIRAPLFVPMMEVKVYFKGRFMVDMKPRYYPAFWGFITNVTENYSGGLYKINLSCADFLHWWDYCDINIHPIPESDIMSGGGLKLTAFATVFDRMNPYEILYQLAATMGMHEFVTVSWAAQKTPLQSIYPTKLFKKVTAGIMSYWQQRLPHMTQLLKMYGMNGKRVNKNGIQQLEPEGTIAKKSGDSEKQEATEPQDRHLFSVNRDYIQKFQIFADYMNMGKWNTAEFMTKLQIAISIKTKTNFEFFQDVDGNWIFKPPFYNLNVKGLMPYTILPNDIISYTFSTDTEGLTTVLTVNTPMDKNIRTTSYCLGKGFHMDIDLAKKYGIRHQEVTIEYIRDDTLAKTLGLGQMTLMNAKTVTGSITIPGRPELRLGYPVYVEHRDSFHYVKSINHIFDYAGTFSTTLSLQTERGKIWDPKTDFREPFKDIVYRYTGKAVKEQEKKEVEEAKKKKAKKPEDYMPPQIYSLDKNTEKKQELMRGNLIIHSMQQGKYELSPRRGELEMSVTTTTVPYTDVDGYRLIGSFAYGRALNAACIQSNTSELPVMKEVYLTTMARPVYTNESAAMDVLFFKDKEGAVPLYLNLGEKGVPSILGALQEDIDLEKKRELDTIPTENEKEKSEVKKAKRKITTGQVSNVTNAGVGGYSRSGEFDKILESVKSE